MGHSQEMSEGVQTTSRSWWRTSLLDRVAEMRQHEDQVILVLALVIGALTGLAVVAFILLTERMGMRLYPVGAAGHQRMQSEPFPNHKITETGENLSRGGTFFRRLLDKSSSDSWLQQKQQ